MEKRIHRVWSVERHGFAVRGKLFSPINNFKESPMTDTSETSTATCSAVFEFDRYVRGEKKAEGCRILNEAGERAARRKASELFRIDAPDSTFIRRCPDCKSSSDYDSELTNGFVSFLCYGCGYHVLTDQ